MSGGAGPAETEAAAGGGHGAAGVGPAYRRVLGGHIPALDGVRAIAILLVLAHNFDLVSGPASGLGRFIDLAANLGWIGVQLFFVLSGFLITGALLDTRGAANYFGAFFARRVLRIFPLYYATLLVAFVILPLVSPAHAPDGRNQIWLWTYLLNWVEPGGRGVAAFPHFWSLAVEEQFYLLWPFVVRAVLPARLFRLAIGLLVAAFAARVALRAAGVDVAAVYMWSICRMDALAAGAALAVFLRLPGGPETVERRWRALSVATVVIGVGGFLVTRGLPRTSLATQTVGYSILVWVFAYLVLAAVRAEAVQGIGAAHAAVARVLDAAPLRSIGRYSYAMYVFHVPIHAILGARFIKWWGGGSIGGAGALVYIAVASGVTYLAAMASYHLFEARLLALKRHFPPRSSPTPPPSVATAASEPA
jgi:peptidoglycan/LPS O-acetylase OafA/YrhL